MRQSHRHKGANGGIFQIHRTDPDQPSFPCIWHPCFIGGLPAQRSPRIYHDLLCQQFYHPDQRCAHNWFNPETMAQLAKQYTRIQIHRANSQSMRPPNDGRRPSLQLTIGFVFLLTLSIFLNIQVEHRIRMAGRKFWQFRPWPAAAKREPTDQDRVNHDTNQ